jgi:hypothetical protein
MSQPIYEIYSHFLGLAKEESKRLYKFTSAEYREHFEIPLNKGMIIEVCCNFSELSNPVVIAGLLTLASTVDNPTFWENFCPSITYIFLEFAKNNFFPITYNLDVNLNVYRQKFETIITEYRQYKNVFPNASNKVKKREDYLEHISCRARGTSTRLANLVIAAEIIPDGLFDWDSCMRGDEPEQLMMFGIQELDPEVFNKWVKLYEEYGDY